MKYMGMPAGMWVLYKKSFGENLVSVLGFSKSEAAEITAGAKHEYKKIIDKLPEFEKADRFKMNIVNCALLAAFILNMKVKPDVDKLADYYARSLMNKPTVLFCRMEGRKKFGKKDIEGMKATSELKAADRNPYSWNMDFYPYEDGSGYEARFTKCGICVLMKELGLYDLVPAMCRLDYTMTDAGGTAEFVREYTLASDGPYCDCGYIKKKNRGAKNG
ncbi:MAG: L-2-amino-thiazoline-4-carboxylic acid hydrolase [Clostridia bacterium]|nr:L-2-amino-thiazoline-4-carboxylic acid hydrolase [Clostridia bacterium]